MRDGIHRSDQTRTDRTRTDRGGDGVICWSVRRGGFVTALLVSLLVACSSGSGVTAPEEGRAELEYSSFTLINAERVASEVSPELERRATLDEIARRHSERMRDEGFFSHTTPEGQSLRDRLVAEGYSFTAAGENIAQVTNAPDPASHAHRLLMGNRAHRNNILGDGYREVGVGVAIEGRTVWITQIYVRSGL